MHFSTAYFKFSLDTEQYFSSEKQSVANEKQHEGTGLRLHYEAFYFCFVCILFTIVFATAVQSQLYNIILRYPETLDEEN